jgi:superfamily II DNA or RNA helicase
MVGFDARGTAMSDPVRALVRAALGDGERSVPDLLRAVRARGGAGVSRAALERALEADPACVPVEELGRIRWRLDADLAAADAGAPGAADAAEDAGAPGAADVAVDRAASRAGLDALALRDWQVAALAAWSAPGRGVVEAVTGSGKTRLALAAVRLVVERGGVVLVLVPTLGLQDQWVRELGPIVPQGRIGRLGGGHADDLDRHAVLVATPQSAAGLPIEPPYGVPGLLVADEAHRFGAPTWADALKPSFVLRLALTATFEREDDGVVDVLAPYFGEVVHRYDYADAARDGTIAPFDLTLIGVPLTASEQERHDTLDARVRRLTGGFVSSGGLPRDPRALIAALSAIVGDAERTGRDGPQVRAAREYLSVVRERRSVSAGAARKSEVVAALVPALVARRTLVFTDTVEQAEAVVGVLRRAGAPAATVHGELEDRQRRSRLARFGRGELVALAAPRVLDEGVDLPDADVALALSAFRTRRHLIQRLGRVLRLKSDGRAAHLLLLHASGTLEDPARGGHHGFLTQVDGVARAREDVVLHGDAFHDALAAVRAQLVAGRPGRLPDRTEGDR